MSFKVNAMVSYIRLNDIFDLDVMDLDDMSPYDVLDHFGLGEVLDENEEALLMDEMYRLAGAVQTAEIRRNTPIGIICA
jgi:hypothetical protein